VRKFLVVLALGVVCAVPSRSAAQSCLTAAAQTFCIPDVSTASLPDSRMARFNETDIVLQQQGATGEGVVSGAVVTAQGTPDLTVAVSSGEVLVSGTLATVASGNVTITTPDSFSPRWDLIVVSSAGAKSAVAGTASSSPKIPALPANSVPLAAVWVTPGTSAITSFAIVPKRFVVQSSLATVTAYGPFTPHERLMLPMGEVSYFSTTGTAITITTQSDGSTNMVVVPVVTTGNFDLEFDNGGANNGRLRYTGAVTKVFHVACSWSLSGTGGDIFVVGVAQNGSVIAASKVLQTEATNARNGNALHVVATLETNDYLELYIGNTSDTSDPTVYSLNLFAMGM